MTNRVLLTGSTGFLGSQLGHSLRAGGWEVLPLAMRHAQTTEPEAAVTPGRQLADKPDGRSPGTGTVLVHLAGVSGRFDCTPETCLEAVEFGRRAITAAAGAGADTAILVSSIYATLAEKGAATAYGEHKLEVERVFVSEFTGRIVILRLPPVYGGDTDRSSIVRLASIVRHGWPLPLGLARAPRDYLALENFLELVGTLLERDISTGAGERVVAYEPCDGKAVSTAQLVRILGEVVGRPARLLPVPEPALRVVAAAVGKADLLQAAFAPLLAQGNERLTERWGWKPSMTMPASLQYLRDRS